MPRRALPADALEKLLASNDPDTLGGITKKLVSLGIKPKGTKMPKKTIKDCLDDVCRAHDAALKTAAHVYPKGTRVGVMLSARQVNPSPATVRGWSVRTYDFGDGTRCHLEIRVEMDHYKSHRSRFQGVGVDMIREL